MDYNQNLWILVGVGVVFTIFLIYYVIRVERKIVRIILNAEKRIKKEKEAMKEAVKQWEKKH